MNKDTMDTIAFNITRLRGQAKLSSARLATMIGVSQLVMGQYESGGMIPVPDKLARLAKVFNVTVDELKNEPKPIVQYQFQPEHKAKGSIGGKVEISLSEDMLDYLDIVASGVHFTELRRLKTNEERVLYVLEQSKSRFESSREPRLQESKETDSFQIPRREESLVISRNIKYLREKAGWSKNEVAMRLSTQAHRITTYEEGSCVPSFKTIIRLAQIFKVPVESLMNIDLVPGKLKTAN